MLGTKAVAISFQLLCQYPPASRFIGMHGALAQVIRAEQYCQRDYCKP